MEVVMKYLKPASILTAIVIVGFCIIVGYYYFTTPTSTIIVSAQDFPAGLRPGFTPDALMNAVVGRLQEISAVADSSNVSALARQQGLGPRPVKQPVIPVRALSKVPSPVFDQKWKGFSFDLARKLGVSLRAQRFLAIDVIAQQPSGWRLAAALEERPQFVARSIASAPRGGGACPDFEVCIVDLSEQIERSLDYPRLLNYYITKDTPDADSRVVDLYSTMQPAPAASDDLVAWGNAFYGLSRFDEALQKYQEALNKDSAFCPARIARGYLYRTRPHEGAVLADLRRAVEDFRAGIACNARNEFAETNLCSTLLAIRTNSLDSNPQLLDEAKEHCEAALKMNPDFVAAAVNVGYVLYRQGGKKEAIEYFDKLSQRYPTNSVLYLNYGFLLYLEYLAGDRDALKQATERTLQAWRLDPKSWVAANNLGFFYYEQEDYPRALEFWKNANDIKPDEPDCVAGLALGFYRNGETQLAVSQLSRAIRLDARYRDPVSLRRNDNWSANAAADLEELLRLLPPRAKGAETQVHFVLAMAGPDMARVRVRREQSK
jgi:tetratricopeptide (TPR) repeat protein